MEWGLKEYRISAIVKKIWLAVIQKTANKEENKVTGEEFMELYNCNPGKIEFEGTIYTESDLSAMDREDYEEVMEYGKVIED